MLVASFARTEALVVPAARAAAAVEAAASAAPCIVRFVRYQLAASVPSPAKPMTAVSDSAIPAAVLPVRSARILPSHAVPAVIEPAMAHHRPHCAGLISVCFTALASF